MYFPIYRRSCINCDVLISTVVIGSIIAFHDRKIEVLIVRVRVGESSQGIQGLIVSLVRNGVSIILI